MTSIKELCWKKKKRFVFILASQYIDMITLIFSFPSPFTGSACTRTGGQGAPGRRAACHGSRSQCPIRAQGQIQVVFMRLVVGKRKTNRLQVLLDLGVEGTGLERNNLRGSIGVVGNGRAALGAEESVDGVSRSGRAGPLLDGAVDGEGGFGDDGDEGWRGS